MFDFRIYTFLTLCHTKNYTKAAELLHITQPAVTGHIKYLEERYHMKLFTYTGKSLQLTSQGMLFQKLATTVKADMEKELRRLQHLEDATVKINFGATLTIGEYTMPPLLCKYLDTYPHHLLLMHVDNTDTLLHLLNEGALDFALIEGYFNKTEYTYRLFSKEAFIAVCSGSSPLAHTTLSLDELTHYRLIIREPGSGSRAIVEEALHEQCMTLEAFPKIMALGNLNAIKTLVKQDYGITFIYEEAVKEELATGVLAPIHIKGLTLNRAFHFICPKNSLFTDDYLDLFEFFKHSRV